MSEFSRYIIGIDLGTTNCCVSYIDTDGDNLIKIFEVPQLTSAGVVESKNMLSSFYYFAGDYEFPEKALSLPWNKDKNHFVGVFARDHGSKVATRLVRSAKSWLCNSAASRREKILPVESADPDSRISPVEATTAYLEHIKEAWNYSVAKGDPEKEFEYQEITLTVPASFDEIARRLTVEAAQHAGYKNLTLLEEPQSAFYHWIQRNTDSWKNKMKLGDTVLICDVGGGTTDFSWIEVDENFSFQRKEIS